MKYYIYRCHVIEKTSDILFPYLVQEFLLIHKLNLNFTCRFRNLSAAKAAITRYIKTHES